MVFVQLPRVHYLLCLLHGIILTVNKIKCCFSTDIINDK
jgi:hypothetical protein